MNNPTPAHNPLKRRIENELQPHDCAKKTRGEHWGSPVTWQSGQKSVLPSLTGSPVAPRVLAQRAAGITSFESLLDPRQFYALAAIAVHFEARYDGKKHAQYCLQVKTFLRRQKQSSLTAFEQSQLMAWLSLWQPASHWSWRSLTITIHSLTSVGAFYAHQNVTVSQFSVMSALFSAVASKCQQEGTQQNIDDIGIINIFWAGAKLVESTTVPPQLKQALHNLLPLVIQRSDRFEARGTANLIWALGKLAEYLELTPEFTQTVLALLPMVIHHRNQFANQGLASLPWALGKLVDSGLALGPELNDVVDVLIPRISERSLTLNTWEVGNSFRGIAKLVEHGLVLTTGRTTAIMVLQVSVSGRINQFTLHDLVILLWAFAKLLEKGLLLTPDLNTTVSMLLTHTSNHLEQLHCQTMTDQLWTVKKLLWPVAKLLDFGLSLMTSRLIGQLLPQVSKFKVHISAQMITHAVWGAARQVEQGTPLTPELSGSVISILSLTDTQKEQLAFNNIASLLLAMAKLAENGLGLTTDIESASTMLLIMIPTRPAPDQPQSVSSLLRAVVKMIDLGLTITPDIQNALTTVLPIIDSCKDELLVEEHIALLWSLAKLVGCMLPLTPEISAVVAELLLGLPRDLCRHETCNSTETITALPPAPARKSHLGSGEITTLLWIVGKLLDSGFGLQPELIAISTPLVSTLPRHMEQLNAKEVANSLWAMVKLVENEFGLTPPLNEAITALLSVVPKHQDYTAEHLNNMIRAIAVLAKEDFRRLEELKAAISFLLAQVPAVEKQLSPRHVCVLLWSLASMGELVVVPETITTTLMLALDDYHRFTRHQLALSMWGLMVRSACNQLGEERDDTNLLQQKLHQLFAYLATDPVDDERDITIIAMTASWLGVACPVTPTYLVMPSQNQDNLTRQLRAIFPVLNIEDERSINCLPPVDLYLPDLSLIIEVQGPAHFSGHDVTIRNGATILKKALYQQLGYEVMEIPVVGPDLDQSEMNRCIERIRTKQAQGTTDSFRSLTTLNATASGPPME